MTGPVAPPPPPPGPPAPPPGGAVPPPAAGYPGAEPPKGLPIAAMVVGILALVLSICVFFFPFLGLVLGLVALVLGIVARSKVRKGQAGGRGLAITGLITGGLAVLIALAVIAFGAAILRTDTGKCIRDAQGDQTKVQKCIDQSK